MIFNSIEFAIFLPIVFALYWTLHNQLKIQNLFIVCASFFFYGWWDWRFLFLLFISAFVDFWVGILLTKHTSNRKGLLVLSILVNLGILGFFKYYNFFADSFVQAFTLLGRPLELPSLKVILPVGVSFYTFQALSYTIDVYRRKLNPTRNIIDYYAFISFFPQLVAGPIERATNLLPQFYTKRVFDYDKAKDGVRQILWGLFKKMVIADNCATVVNQIFDNYQDYNGATLFIGGILFAFQIYGDFSGYSDVAIGCARLFGFDLMRNFNYPYFSRDIAEFWRRWHISLSTWFRDYVYVPLGGSRVSKTKIIRNTLIIFIVSGFWHGANWTFILWGAYHAFLFLPLILMGKNRTYTCTVAEDSFLPGIKEAFQIALTFFWIIIGWIIFRAESISVAFQYITQMLSIANFGLPEVKIKTILLFISILISVEWVQRKKQHGLDFRDISIPLPIRWGIYYLFAFFILWHRGDQQVFIYFQF